MLPRLDSVASRQYLSNSELRAELIPSKFARLRSRVADNAPLGIIVAVVLSLLISAAHVAVAMVGRN